MSKKIAGLVLMLVLALAVPLSASAQTVQGGSNWAVTYTGSGLESNFKSSQIDEVIYSLQPGDTAQITVAVKNKSSKAADFYMSNEIIQSFEDSNSSASGGSYSYRLVYTAPDGTADVLYDSSSVGGNDETGGVGLHQATSSLGSYFLLGRIESGKSGQVSLTVKLEGETQVNAYQATLAKMEMKFAVEEATSTTPAASLTSTTMRNVVQTGDNSEMILYICLAIFSAGLILLILALRRLRGEPESTAARCLIAGLVLAGICMSVQGTAKAADEPYTYTVRLSGGNQGTLTGTGGVSVQKSGGTVAAGASLNGADIVITGLEYGDRVSFGNAQGYVKLKEEDKYYVRGVRESGRDNSSVGESTFTVEGDADYVVAYGIAGDMVAYTVNYQDASGQALAQSETYYGAAGDKPVLAYLYIEGYQPQAYNLTKTLSTNEADNVFTFVYTPVATETAQAATTTTTTTNEGTTQTTTTTAGAATAAAGNAGAAAEGAAGAEGAGEAGAAEGAEAEDVEVTPQELINLDDEETPLADVDAEEENVRDGGAFPIVMAVAVVIAALAALTGGILYYKKYRRMKAVVADNSDGNGNDGRNAQ